MGGKGKGRFFLGGFFLEKNIYFDRNSKMVSLKNNPPFPPTLFLLFSNIFSILRKGKNSVQRLFIVVIILRMEGGRKFGLKSIK